jgi:hypothetical protein
MEAMAAERKAPRERRRRRGPGRRRTGGERLWRGRPESHRDGQEEPHDHENRPPHVIVTGVPIGSKRPSARIAELRNRMHPCDIRPGIRPG